MKESVDFAKYVIAAQGREIEELRDTVDRLTESQNSTNNRLSIIEQHLGIRHRTDCITAILLLTYLQVLFKI